MESRRFDVVVVGELNPDMILSGNVLPEFGQVEKLVDRAALTIGSSSAIFACGASRLGLRVAFIGKVGRDIFGNFMCQSLDEYGIDTSGIVIDEDSSTGISVILSTDSDRAILTYPGTIPLLKYADIKWAIIEQARHLHVGSYFIQDALRPDIPALFARAHSMGLSVSLDTNYDPLDRWDGGVKKALQDVDLFLPNALECQRIAGVEDLEQAISRLKTKVSLLGVKRGTDGATICSRGEVYQIKPLDVKVVDTVGAGDSFDAGFIYGYLAGWPALKILEMAVACGSLSTRQSGGTAAQPSLEEAIHYMNSIA